MILETPIHTVFIEIDNIPVLGLLLSVFFYRKAMKATIVLLPLLSITSLFFIYAPDIDVSEAAHFAYRITTACLQVAQVCFYY